MFQILERHKFKVVIFCQSNTLEGKRAYWAQSNMWLFSELNYRNVESVVWYCWTHEIQIFKGIQSLFELHEFSNYKSSDYFVQILTKISRYFSSLCGVLYRLRNSNIYKFFLSETFISFSITILLKLTEIWGSEYCRIL